MTILNIMKYIENSSPISKQKKSELATEMKTFFLKNKNEASFVPIIKNGFLKSGKPFTNNIIKSPAELDDCLALAVIPNNENVGVIDFDQVDEVNLLRTKPLRKYVFENLSSFFISYHGPDNLTVEEIILTKKFKILVKPNASFRKLASYYQKFSTLRQLHFEIFCTPQTWFTIVGEYRDGFSYYKNIGGIDRLNALKPCSNTFFEHFKNLLNINLTSSSFKTGKRLPHIFNNTTQRMYWKVESEALFISKSKEIFKGKRDEFFDPKEKVVLRGICPSKQFHSTTKEGPKDFSLTYYPKTNSINFFCYHLRCHESNTNLCNSTFQPFFLWKKEQPKKILKDFFLNVKWDGGLKWSCLEEKDFILLKRLLQEVNDHKLFLKPMPPEFESEIYTMRCLNHKEHKKKGKNPHEFTINYNKQKQTFMATCSFVGCKEFNIKFFTDIFNSFK